MNAAKATRAADVRDAVAQFVSAMNQGNVEAALAMYEPQAVIVARPGVMAQGTAALREALAAFIALKPTLTSEVEEVVEAGDIALYCSRWSLRGTDPAGQPVQMSGRSSDVLRRQRDGSWLIAVDNPWGTDIVG